MTGNVDHYLYIENEGGGELAYLPSVTLKAEVEPWPGSLGGALSHTPKGGRFDPWPERIPIDVSLSKNQ